MSKKTGTSSGVPVLLDSTYLLPVFGVAVREIDDKALSKLRHLALEKMIVLYYSPVSFIEIVAKVARETVRRRVGLKPDELANTIEIIQDSHYMKPLNPDAQAYALAYKMRLLGHKDMIDNLLYAIASIKGLVFISMDQTLRNFVQHHKIAQARIMTHYELFKILESLE